MNDNTGVHFPCTLTSRHPNQEYYWSATWQEAEREARADIAAGRVTILGDALSVDTHFGALMKPKKRQHR